MRSRFSAILALSQMRGGKSGILLTQQQKGFWSCMLCRSCECAAASLLIFPCLVLSDGGMSDKRGFGDSLLGFFGVDAVAANALPLYPCRWCWVVGCNGLAVCM
ncbi:hypothetical protein BDZ91DRAFT_738216 [Kalaharituber pfeilii]|nr:hypothetical protein BDZ91DRAFT_738216 [Kalaharituber pfeilii]